MDPITIEMRPLFAPANWELRDPKEYLSEALDKALAATAEYERRQRLVLARS